MVFLVKNNILLYSSIVTLLTYRRVIYSNSPKMDFFAYLDVSRPLEDFGKQKMCACVYSMFYV